MARHEQTDAERIEQTHNTARFFVENRSLSWVLLVAVVAWGVWAYVKMPKRKDPDVPARVAAAVCAWPGIGAEKIEQQLTRRIEEAVAQNPRIHKIESLSQTNVAIILIFPDENVADLSKEFDDIRLRLDSIHDLPQGAGPIEFFKDFGDSAALMLTVASPKTGAAEIAWRAKGVREAIERVRARAGTHNARTAVIVCFPLTLNPLVPQRLRDLFLGFARENQAGRDLRPLEGAGFVGVDGELAGSDAEIANLVDRFYSERLRPSERHPDMWHYAVVREPGDVEARLTSVAADKYTYRQMSDFTDLIQHTLQTLPLVSRVTRSGVLKENIFLEYSQQRLASFGLQPSLMGQILNARNNSYPGGLLESQGKSLVVDPTGRVPQRKRNWRRDQSGLRLRARPFTCGIQWISYAATKRPATRISSAGAIRRGTGSERAPSRSRHRCAQGNRSRTSALR